MRKDIAILGGGDWTDASCEHLSIDKDADLEKLHKEYRDWYTNGYKKPWNETGQRPKYYTFAEYLIKFHGASKDHGVEVIES